MEGGNNYLGKNKYNDWRDVLMLILEIGNINKLKLF